MVGGRGGGAGVMVGAKVVGTEVVGRAGVVRGAEVMVGQRWWWGHKW